MEWQTSHEDQGYLMLPDEGLLLTGDELMLELTAEAQYSIRDLREFVEGTADPAAVLRAVLESSVREVVARKPLEALLGESRVDVERACLLTARQGVEPHRLGLTIASLHLLDVHPPGGVVPAYRDVANALEEREQLLNIGHAIAARTLLSTAGEPAMSAFDLSVRPARDEFLVDPNGRLDGAPAPESSWTLDDDRWRALSADGPQGVGLAGAAAVRLNAAHASRATLRMRAEGSQARFSTLRETHRQSKTLTSIALYWQAIERALADRPLILIDPDAQGRRQVWLPESSPVEPIPPPVPPIPQIDSPTSPEDRQ